MKESIAKKAAMHGSVDDSHISYIEVGWKVNNDSTNGVLKMDEPVLPTTRLSRPVRKKICNANGRLKLYPRQIMFNNALQNLSSTLRNARVVESSALQNLQWEHKKSKQP